MVTLTTGMVLVLALIIAPVAADTMIRENATNRLGEDYTSLGLETPGYDGTAESCSANCLSQPSCNAATFVEWDQSCWLKETVPPATSESGLTSFVRQKSSPAVTITTGAAQTVPTESGGTKAPGFEWVFAILGCLGVLVVRRSMR
ncbi:MAG TPA: PAN domain-containing protein [Methanoregula sp.]|nr:PAN domain-containing protein [Methanoregula sp.]